MDAKFIKMTYHYATRTGYLYIEADCRADMGECVDLFARGDPDVQCVNTFLWWGRGRDVFTG